jgi:cytochrome c biogenesis protein ResB
LVIFKKIYDFLTSRRVSVIVLLIVGGISLVGAAIPQKELPAYYEAHYEAWAVKLFNILGLTNVYRTWYFVGLLSFLLLAILTCTIRRTPAIIRLFANKKPSLAAFERSECRAAIGPAAAYDNITGILKRLPFTWREVGGAWYGRRRAVAVFGEILTHVGLILLFVGGLLRGFGHRDEIHIFDGYGVALPPAYGEGYEIRADSVDEIVDANTGKTLEYRTGVRVFRYGDEVAAGDVEVNGPLRYGGWGLYQSDMNADGARGLMLESVELKKGATVEDYGRAKFSWKIGDGTGELELAPGEEKEMGETGFRLRHLGYLERFTSTEEGFSDGGPEYNPTAFVHVTNPRGDVATGLLFKLHPEQSFIRGTVPDFVDGRFYVLYEEDGGPWRAGRREYLFASGSYLPFAGGRAVMHVAMAEGEGEDLRSRALKGVLTPTGGDPREFEFPFGERVGVEVGGDVYAVRFMGAQVGAVSGLTVARDPGLWFFYVGCLLLSLGVIAALLIRFEELMIYTHDGQTYVAGRSNKGARVTRPWFEEYAAEIEKEIAKRAK